MRSDLALGELSTLGAAAIMRRSRTAAVEIPYSSSDYAIHDKSSIDLQAADGKIHRNDSSWVVNLTRNINAQLAAS